MEPFLTERDVEHTNAFMKRLAELELEERDEPGSEANARRVRRVADAWEAAWDDVDED